MVLRWSTPAGVARDECMVDIPNHDLRKGTASRRRLRGNQPDSFVRDAQLIEAEL
jgi:hypothetical protein